MDLQRAEALGVALAPSQSISGEVVPGYQIGTLKGLTLGNESLGDVKLLADGTLSYRDLKDRT